MKVRLIQVGQTDEAYLKEGGQKYVDRLKHYCKFEQELIPDLKNVKNLSRDDQKRKEGELILKKIDKNQFVMLLDERGREFDSKGFAGFLQKRMNTGMDLTFVIGGPFGFSDEVYSRGDSKIALSQMTFSHQMVRLFFTEQLYRGFSILKGEKYHH